MNKTQESMFMFTEQVAWWPKNQVALTFHSPLNPTQDNKQPIIDSLHLDDINRFLGEKLQLTLQSFEDKDISHPSEEEEPGESLVDEGLGLLGKAIKAVGEGVERLGEGIEELGEKLIDHAEKDEGGSSGDGGGEQDEDDQQGLNNPRGKYLFPSPDPEEPGSTLIAFFNINPAKGAPGDGADRTVDVVNLFNTTPFIIGSSGERIPIPPTSPNWYGGATPDVIHGCPAVPPMPVPTNSSCTSGDSQISFQDLNEEIQNSKGEGVRVLILDTIPSPDIITNASNKANPPGGVRNLLLQDMASGMKSSNKFDDKTLLNAEPQAINVYYQSLSNDLENGDVPKTGKDINLQLVGYEIQDHGLFVAGIIRTLAPRARIECVRLLNDFGVNKLSSLVQALETIQFRMVPPDEKTGKKAGDLWHKHVVINLSLVMTPYDDMFSGLGFKTPDDSHLRKALHKVIKSLVTSGAVIVAAVGNDSHSREMPGQMGPRHPAAYPEVVAVAAVEGVGDENKAAPYSNSVLPDLGNGIATYGGGVATPENPQTPGLPVAPTPTNCMTGAKDIDALVGVYTSLTYPRLVGPEPPDETHPHGVPGDCNETYPALKPDNYWAYWSGTSFSTPIISALVARILESMGPGTKLSSQQVITKINSPDVITDSPLPFNKDLKAHVLDVGHCQDGGVIE